MTTQAPSARNVEIYNRIHFGGESLRMIADVMSLSATRVNEICRQVERWYQQSQPDWAAEMDRNQQAAATWRMHLARLKYLYGESMHSWHESQKPRMVSTDANNGTLRTVTTNHFGEMRYLRGAMLMSREMALASTAMLRLPDACFVPVVTDPNNQEPLIDNEDEPVVHVRDLESANNLDDSEETPPPVSAGAPPAAVEAPIAVPEPKVEIASPPAVETCAPSDEDILKTIATVNRILASLRAPEKEPRPAPKSANNRRPEIVPVKRMHSQADRRRELREALISETEQARIGPANRFASNKIQNSVS